MSDQKGSALAHSRWTGPVLRSTDQADRLTALVINDIGPDIEAGSNRITGMIGPRPDAFVTFEAAVAYRREISPITAARPVEDQDERKHAVSAAGWVSLAALPAVGGRRLA